MLDAEEQMRVMMGFDDGSEVDYSLAAGVLSRIVNAALARARANGNDDVTCSTQSWVPDAADPGRKLPSAVFYLHDGLVQRTWYMSVGRVVSESSKRDPENEWCIGYGHNGVAYVPKLITDDLVQALAERLAPFSSNTHS